MDFGDILDEWEKETAKPYGKRRLKEDEHAETECTKTGKNKSKELSSVNPMDMWLRRYGVQDKDATLANERESISPAERRRRLRSMKPEAMIDLHGLTRDEAWARLEAFFADAYGKGLQKVLIIHGKGTHSDEEPVLNQMVRLFVEQNPHAGESGYAATATGGAGATWVILK